MIVTCKTCDPQYTHLKSRIEPHASSFKRMEYTTNWIYIYRHKKRIYIYIYILKKAKINNNNNNNNYESKARCLHPPVIIKKNDM